MTTNSARTHTHIYIYILLICDIISLNNYTNKTMIEVLKLFPLSQLCHCLTSSSKQVTTHQLLF